MLWGTPFSRGPFRTKNRIVYPPLTPNWATPEGCVTDRFRLLYRNFAEGGAGMVIVCGTAVSGEGKGSDLSLGLWDEKQLPGMGELASILAAGDCLASIQLMHVGGQGNPRFTGSTPVSPSGLPCAPTGFTSRALAHDEVRRIRDDFIRSAVLASRAGFPTIELHMSHGYLLHEFLSPFKNRRTDEYGGSLENRLRLVLEIIEGIRHRAPDLMIGARVSGDDFVEEGIDMDANREILPCLTAAGVCYFSLTAGIYETSPQKHEVMKNGGFFRYAREARAIVQAPVIGVGKILDIASAEARLQAGDCDLVAIGRGLLADPHMPRKALEGRSPVRCTECNECAYLRFGRKDLHCPLWDPRTLLPVEPAA